MHHMTTLRGYLRTTEAVEAFCNGTSGEEFEVYVVDANGNKTRADEFDGPDAQPLDWTYCDAMGPQSAVPLTPESLLPRLADGPVMVEAIFA